MTHKERMLSVFKGEPTDFIPWAPRLDLWYNANKRAGTLPAEYRNATLRDIADDQNFGYHAIVPQFKDLRNPLDDLHRALGIYNLWTMPYSTRLQSDLESGDHLVLGISDTTPPAADFERIRSIGERARSFGPVEYTSS